MSMDPQYKALHDQVHNLQFQVHDAIGDHSHPSAQLLNTEIVRLQDDLELHKHPRDIENRIKTIQHTLLEARNQPSSYMNFNHAEQFYHTYEDMRRHMRNFPGY